MPKCAVYRKTLSSSQRKYSRPVAAYIEELTSCLSPLELGQEARICSTCRVALTKSRNPSRHFRIHVRRTLFLSHRCVYVKYNNIRKYIFFITYILASGKMQARQGWEAPQTVRNMKLARALKKDAGTQTTEKQLSLTLWTVEDTCFGEILRGPCGRTLFPPGLYEEMKEKMQVLSRRKLLIHAETNVYRLEIA